MNNMLKRRRLPTMNAQRYGEVFEFPVDQYYRRLGFDFSCETFEALGTEFILGYENNRRGLRLRPGARSILKNLIEAGAQQFVLSAYRHDTLESLLREKNILRYFKKVSGSDDHYARGKIEQGRRMIKSFGMPRHSTVLIGDTVHDHEVANEMGVACLLIESGHQNRHKLEACGRRVFSNISAVRKYLMGVS